MFIKKISEFATFLSLKEHLLEELLAHLIHCVLADLEVSSIFISSLNHLNQVEMFAQHGIDPKIWEKYPQGTSVFEKYPITDALRFRKTIWINTLPNWGDEYPLLNKADFPSPEKTFICLAIEKSNTPVAVMGMFARPVIQVDAEVDSFLTAVSSMVSLFLYQRNHPATNKKELNSRKNFSSNNLKDEKLTERQLLILRLISEARTNLLISELLGYSESTIRQESIKIYSKLGCNGRVEASKIYKERFAETGTEVSKV